MSELFQFASCFFRVSHDLLTTRLLTQAAPIAPPDPFLTLSTASLLEAANDNDMDTGDGLADKQLAMVADQGESELGQMFLRDFVLSFTLPRSVIGTRRAPLLSREQNAMATQHHSDVVANAHDVAMRGAQWTWHNDRDDFNRTCALLAGLCAMRWVVKTSIRAALALDPSRDARQPRPTPFDIVAVLVGNALALALLRKRLSTRRRQEQLAVGDGRVSAIGAHHPS